MAAGPRLLVRSAPRLRLGSLMPRIKARTMESGCHLFDVCRRDFSHGVISAKSEKVKTTFCVVLFVVTIAATIAPD